MIREAIREFLSGRLSRRDFIRRAGEMGVGATAASQLANTAVAATEETQPVISLSNVTGGDITCETLKSWGVDYVFGNTGAYEAPVVDSLVVYPEIQYVLGLHEGAVMAMADGYARASGKIGFVNVHSITGTANALGLIVNAWADDSPVVISVGFSATDYDTLGVFTETQKLETIPELYTKLSFRASELQNYGESLRRAFRLASVLPSGPVFIGVPNDVWRETLDSTEIIPADRTVSDTKIYPDRTSIRQAVEWLAEAKNPLLVSGAELPRWGGLGELGELADTLGATVSGDTSSSRSSMGFPSDHPRYLSAMRGPIEADPPFDVVLLAGTSRLSLSRRGHPLIPKDAKIIELGLREDHLVRSYPADLVLYAHPQVTLARLNAGLKRVDLDTGRIAARRKAGEALTAARRQRLRAELERVYDDVPIAPERLAAEIDKALEADALVVTEGVSSDRPIWNYVRFDQPGGGREHLISSGGSLGWGLGAGVGAKLGRPDDQVAILLGDGSYQFGVQALWTAKRFELPLIVVIFNNRGYQANRWAIHGLGRHGAETGQYIGITLDDPDIDHVGMARAYGLDGERVTDPDALAAALKRATAAEREGRAYILDVIVDKRGPGADQAGWHEGMGSASDARDY